MAETILTILKLSVLIAIPSSMLVLSLQAGRPYIRELFQNPKLLIRYFLVVFIFIPSIALLLLAFDTANHRLWLGVLVIVLSPIAPGMLKSINKLGGDSKISIAWMTTAIFISIIMLPLTLYIITPLLFVNIDLGIDDVIIKLSTLFIVPILIGFVINLKFAGIVPALVKVFDIISKSMTIVLVICLAIVSVPVFKKSDPFDFLLIFLFVIISIVIAHFMEIPGRKYGPVLTFSVALRVPASAVVIAGVNYKTMEFLPIILSYVLIGTIVMAVYKKLLLKKENKIIH